MPPDLYLLRLAAEVATKSNRTRRRFQQRLVRNLEDALASSGIRASVRDHWSRIFVELKGTDEGEGDVTDGGVVGVDDRDPLASGAAASDPGEPLSRVFGLSSASPVDALIPADLDAIVETGHALYADRIRGRTYAVRCRRVGEHPFSSRDVKRQLGAALNSYGEVDLDEPEVTVAVEIRHDEAFLFHRRIDGPGGLPLGVEGKGVCLISGGFDSAVAAWLMLKRGISLEYVFCNLGGAAYERSVVSVTKVLSDDWSYGDHPSIHVVDFEGAVRHLQDRVTPRYWQVVLKRLMYRTAEIVAQEVGADAIITGESVGQVSSQTLGNLRAIDDVASLPVFRPLLGLDKQEIIERADRIGTSALSARIREYCAILPDRPVTHSSPRAAADEEAKLDLELVAEAVADRKVMDLRSLDPFELVEPYIFIDEVPKDAVVVDCQTDAEYERWHWPGADHRSPRWMASQLGQLERDRTYLLYCARGVQTAHLAEMMQREGFEAYTFRGGAARLRKLAEEGRAAASAGSNAVLEG